MEWPGVDSPGLGYEPVAVACEHGDEPSDAAKC
jgi:hypothetical protein